MFEVKVDANTIHITGTEAAQSPCTDLVLKADRMEPIGQYVNVHDAIVNAKASATRKRTTCRHCLAAASRI
jgi:hypothetical protein